VKAQNDLPRVAVVTPYFPTSKELYRGHSAYQTLRLMRHWADLHVFCPLATYPDIRFLHPRGYRYHRADLSFQPPDLRSTYFEYPVFPAITRPLNGWTCARYLRPHLQKFRPDLILNYWLYPEGYAAVKLGKELGVPSAVCAIGSDIKRIQDPLTFRLTCKTLREACFVITVSEDLRSCAIRMGASPHAARTVVNGCDRSIFHPAGRAEARTALGVDHNTRLILFVGWLSPTKGLSELLEALNLLIPSYPDVKLACVGEGFYRKTMEERAAAGGIADRLLFTGRLTSTEIARWLAASDVFCLPSHSEGCPNAVIEAIACGRPVVGTRVGGFPDLVSESCGFLVEPRHPAQLANALAEALRRSWCPERISSQFGRSWEDAAKETWQICRDLLSEKCTVYNR
jgi:glycosyltransferase involved in cell wall biosynthesis